jgi:hypothetical protein
MEDNKERTCIFLLFYNNTKNILDEDNEIIKGKGNLKKYI